jgi:hypothetical protein
MIAWRKSSFSDTPNSCVEVRHESDVVYVRDSKLGDDSPVLRFAAASWLVLTDAIVAPRDGDPWKIVHRSIAYEPDGHVLLSTSDRSPELRFDADEWKAFVYGVRAGEFDPEKLSEEVTSEPGCDGSDKAATGAVEEGCRTPGSAVPVAAPLNVPAGRPGEDTPPVSPGLPAVNGQPGPDLSAAAQVVDGMKPAVSFSAGADYLMARQWAIWAYEAGAAQGFTDANEWAKRAAPLVPAVETQETVS